MSTYAAYRTAEQPPGVKTYKAALYIRLSKEDGDKTESDSVVNQKKLLTSFVEHQPDIGLAGYYVDDGYSGASFNRPDFLRMMSDIYSGEVNCVIVKDSSRFGRNASESGRYIGEVFPRIGVRYIAVNDAIDSGKSRSVAIDFLNNSMRGMINEYYVAANSESIRSTLDMERRRGYFIGSFAKYGYKKDPADRHKLIIDEEAAEVVRLIYRMYLNGSGIRTIVRYLNDNGIPNPSTYKRRLQSNYRTGSIANSPLWSDKTVRRTLHDEMYTGNMVQGRFKKVSYKDQAIVAQPEDEWIKVQNTHEAIIKKEDFERAQRMLNNHAKASAVSGEISLFSGLLRCADCGHALIKKTNHNPNKTYMYYRCATHCKCKTACTAHTISYDKLYHTILVCIQKMVDTAVDADIVLTEMRKNRRSAADKNLQTRLQHQERELEKVMNLLADLYPDFKSGILSVDQYRINKQKYERLQATLTQSIEKLKTAIGDPNGAIIRENEFITHFKQHGNIDRLTRPLLTELIEQITVHESGELDIAFNFRDAFEEAKLMAESRLA